MTWLRLTRRLGRCGNPLSRRSDVIEAWLLPGVIVSFLALSPLVAGGAVMWVRADVAAARHTALSWHRVPAVLLRPAAGPEMSDNGANTWVVWTLARWTADGRQRLGIVPVRAKTSAGSSVAVWLDRAGNVQMPPLLAGETRDRLEVAALVALASLAVLLATVALVTRRILDRRRLAGWETAWLSVGPYWTRQG
jgi:hypothetical protein